MGVKKKKEYTEETIQELLNRYFMSYSNIKYFCENLFVFRWESDALLITKSDLIYEFEIKLTKSDFKNDFKNKSTKHCVLESYKTGEKYTPKYYELLEEAQKRGSEDMFKRYVGNSYKVENFKKPHYFYYAVPENLLSVEEVPEYTGLVYITDYYPYVKKVKTAPRINDKKYNIEDFELTDKFYYNYVNWKLKAKKLKEENKILSDRKAVILENEEDVAIEKSKNKTLEQRIALLEKDIKYDDHLIRYLMQKLKDNNIEFEQYPDFVF